MPTYRNDGSVSYRVKDENDNSVKVIPGASVRTLKDLSGISDFVETATIPSKTVTVDVDPGAGLAIGTTKPNVANGVFVYNINGQVYQKAANAAGTALSGDNIPSGQYGAWRLEIGTNGIVDIVPAADNATGYANANLAEAGLPTLSTGHVSMGFVTASKSDGAFDPGTTDLDDANTTEAYTDGDTGGIFTDPVKPNLEDYLNCSVAGASFTATVTLQRSFDAGVTWVDYDTFTANEESRHTDREKGVLYRVGVKNGDYTTGSVVCGLSK